MPVLVGPDPSGWHSARSRSVPCQSFQCHFICWTKADHGSGKCSAALVSDGVKCVSSEIVTTKQPNFLPGRLIWAHQRITCCARPSSAGHQSQLGALRARPCCAVVICRGFRHQADLAICCNSQENGPGQPPARQMSCRHRTKISHLAAEANTMHKYDEPCHARSCRGPDRPLVRVRASRHAPPFFFLG